MYKQQVFDAVLKATNDGLFPIFVLYVHDGYNGEEIISYPYSVIHTEVLTAGAFVNGRNAASGLLIQSEKKLLYISDFASCMKHRRFNDFAIDLRTAFDGEFVKCYGNNGIHWRGSFNLFVSLLENEYHQLCLKHQALVNRMTVVFDKHNIEREPKITFLTKYLPDRKD